MLKTIAFVFMFAIAACGYAADIFHDGDCHFRIRGEIGSGDDKKIYQVFSAASADCEKQWGVLKSIHLNSKGGDVDIAFAIGRAIRKQKLQVFVDADSFCLSACVFILASGVKRYPYGQVGIHRPYFRALDISENEKSVRNRRDLLLQRARQYLDDMDVPQSLLEAMLSVAPDNIRLLNWEELESFRLNSEDATHEEMRVAEAAYGWGLSSSEYRQRDAQVNAICKKTQNQSDERICRLRVLLRVSESEVKRRIERFNALCNMTQTKEQWECYRNVIGLGK